MKRLLSLFVLVLIVVGSGCAETTPRRQPPGAAARPQTAPAGLLRYQTSAGPGLVLEKSAEVFSESGLTVRQMDSWWVITEFRTASAFRGASITDPALPQPDPRFQMGVKIEFSARSESDTTTPTQYLVFSRGEYAGATNADSAVPFDVAAVPELFALVKSTAEEIARRVAAQPLLEEGP